MGDGLLIGIGLVRFNEVMCATKPIENGRFLLLYLAPFGDELLGGHNGPHPLIGCTNEARNYRRDPKGWRPKVAQNL